MASRVNTKFVFLLSGTLIGLVVLLAGFWYFFVFRNPAEQIARAERLAEQGQYDLAAEQYRMALRRRRDDIQLVFTYCDTLAKVRAEDMTTARQARSEMLRWSRAALTLEPANSVALERLLTLYEQMAGETGGAVVWDWIREAADTNLANRGDSVLARRYRGIAQVNRMTGADATDDDRTQALEDLLAVHEAEPNDAEVIYSLIRWHLLEADREDRPGGFPEKAQTLRDEARRLTEQVLPTLPETFDRLIYQARALLVLDPKAPQDQTTADQTDDALTLGMLAARPVIDRLEQLILADLGSPDTSLTDSQVINVATALMTVDRDVVEDDTDGQARSGLRRASQLLRAAVKARPQSIRLQVYLGQLLTMQGMTSEAMQVLKQARSMKIVAEPFEAVVAFNAEAEALFYYADLLLRQAAVETDQDNREAMCNEADSLIRELATRSGGETGPVNLLQGKLSFVRGRIEEAVTRLNQASNQLTSSYMLIDALGLSARAMVLAGQHGAAADQYQRLIPMVGRRPEARYELASLYVQMRKFSLARRQADVLLERDPEDARALTILAAVLANTGQTQQAIDLYRRLNAETDSLLLPALAALVAEAEGPQQAQRLIEARFNQDPANMRLLRELLKYTTDHDQVPAYIQTAREAGANAETLDLLALSYREDLDAAEVVEQRIAAIPDPLSQHIQRFSLYVQTGKLEQARTELEQATKINPDHQSVIERQFRVAIYDQDWARAGQWADRAGQNNTDLAEGLLYAGRLALAKGELDRAVTSLRGVTEKRPVYAQGWQLLGDAQRVVGDFSGAANAYQRALDQQPQNIEALIGLASLQERLGNQSRALDLLRQAYAFAPNDVRVLAQYVPYEETWGETDKALEVRRHRIETEPQDMSNRRGLALLLARTGKIDNALQTIDAVIAKDGTTMASIETKARILIATGRPVEGIGLYQDHVTGLGEQAQVQDWLRLARFYLQIGLDNQAMDAYRQAMAIEDPQTLPATRELARILYRLQRMDQAVQLFRRAWTLDHSDAIFGQQYAEALLHADALDEAEQVLSQLMSNGQSATALALRSILEQKRGDPAQALLTINRAVTIEPNRAVIYLRRAQLLKDDPQMQGQMRADVNRAVELDPALVQARRLKVDLYLRGGETPEAIRELQTLLQRRPDLVADRLRLAQLYIQTKRWLSLETLLEQAIERYPRSPAWPRLQALAEMQQGNIDEAVGKFEHAFELQPTPKALAELTEALITAQRSDEAIETLRAHVELTQQVPPLLAMRGRALAALNQPEQARNAFILAYGRCQDFSPFMGVSNQAAGTWGPEQAYEIALEATQDRDALWIDLALAALEHRLGRYSEAYSRLLQLEPQFRPGAPAGVQPQERDTFENLLASCAHFAGNYEHARDAYRRVLERVPDNMAALNNLAYLLAERLDDAEAALPLAQRAAAYAPRDANIQDTLGWVQFHAGQSDAALQTLLTSLELNPLALTYYHVAEVYLAQGQSDRAVQMFEFAAETAEKSNDKETLDKATQRLNELTR